MVELGTGLGVPALVAAAHGASVTAVDWAADAVELLRRNASGNGLELTVVHADWRSFAGSFDLAIGADLLYERRNAEALLDVLPRLAPEVLLAEPGRPHAPGFFGPAAAAWRIEEAAARVYRLTAAPGAAPGRVYSCTRPQLRHVPVGASPPVAASSVASIASAIEAPCVLATNDDSSAE